MTVHIPRPIMTDAGKVKFATEVAFKILANQAHNMGLPVRIINGFEDLGNAEAQLAFEAGCRAVLEALKPEVPHAT